VGRIVDKRSRHEGKNSRIAGIIAKIAIALTAAAAQTALPAGLESPDSGVICNQQRAICYDRYGASVGLTEAFLGHTVAGHLSASLGNSKPDNRSGTTFSPAEGIECVHGTGPCRFQRQPQAALTAALYGPNSRPAGQTAEMRAIMYGEWDWQRTRHKDGSEARPKEPGHYVLRFGPSGLLNAQVDCNSAGGKYQFEDNRIMLKLTNSTLMSCQPGSLEESFRQNLAAATGYSMMAGRLFLSLSNDAGTMEFDRPAGHATLKP
jgi:heat shock protein HslJ